MPPSSASNSAAKVVVLFVGIAALNAYRRNELGAWARAKFFNDGDPAPAGTSTFASILGGEKIGDGVADAGATVTGTAGDIASSAGLVQVGNTKMSSRFAAKWRPLQAAAAKDGVILTGNAWRSNAAQVELRKKHGCGGSRIYDGTCKGTPPTAVPGKSRHETGDAIDLILSGGGGRNSPEYKWMAKNAGLYGVYNLPSEPWHWSIDGH